MIPGMGASAFSGKFPPNSKGRGPDFQGGDYNRADLIPACGTGLKNSNAYQIMPCEEDKATANTWASARSAHNDGVNAAMGDGSVTFIADDIDARVWHGMCTRAGEEVVSQ